MYFILIIISLLFCFFIFLIISNYQKSKLAFENKIKSLENIIIELTKNLDIQTQKIKLSDDLKLNLNQSNKKIGTAIADLNYQMFNELYKRK